MIRLLAMDLDETLLGSDKHVSEINRIALKKARNNGIHTVIATGRPWFSFVHTLEEIETRHLPDEYSITLNGGAIVCNEDGTPISLDGLDYPAIKALFEKGLGYDVGIHVNTDTAVYGWNLDEDERNFLKGRLDVVELDCPDLEAHREETFIKILYENTDESLLASILEEMQSEADDYDVSFSSSRYIEFNKKGISKGEGLARLAGLLGFDLSQTAAIGDHANDLSMIEAAGIGIAVANAIEPLKQAADYVTEADHNHGAIAQAVDYILACNAKEQQDKSRNHPGA